MPPFRCRSSPFAKAETVLAAYASAGKNEGLLKNVKSYQDLSFSSFSVFPLMALFATGTYVFGSSTSNCKEKESKFSSSKDAIEELSRKLKSTRKSLRQKYQLPKHIQDRKVSITTSDEGTTCISFKLHQFSAPMESAATLINGIAKETSLSVVEVAPLNTSSTSKKASFEPEKLALVYEDGSGSVLVYPPDNRNPRSLGELMFFKDGEVTTQEIDSLVKAYETSVTASILSRRQSVLESTPMIPFNAAQPERSQKGGPEEKLEQLGARVFTPSSTTAGRGYRWSDLAGYENVKRDVEDTILLAVKHPEMYAEITKATRDRVEINKPRAVLFEGPPGCGKTTCARIISSMSEMPMIYIPVEAIMSKFYGESENRLSEIFKCCEEIGPCIIFLDEIDSLATSRSSTSMHEATRRVLSVLLRNLDGFEDRGEKKSVLVAATNRKADLDAALISRFNLSVRFDLPDEQTRSAIFKCYAKHLSENERQILAHGAVNFSGRDIKDVCELAERRWVSKQIRKSKDALSSIAPDVEEYQKAVKDRLLSFDMHNQQDVEY